MENTNKDRNRGRSSRRAGGARARGRGVRPRGASRLSDVSRPSVYEQLFSGTGEDLPAGQPLESPLHPKKARYLREPLIGDRGSDAPWSSLDIPTTSRGDTDTATTTPPLSSAPEEYMVYQPSAVFIECGGSSGPNTQKRKRPASPSVGVKRGRAAHTSSKSGRFLISSSNSSRALHDEEMMTIINYGSEEDSDEEEFKTNSALAPRANRMFLDEGGEEEGTEVDSELVLSWPPQHLRPDGCSCRCGRKPAPPAPASPTLEPSAKFYFQWRAFPVPQIESSLRREPFSNINCGPTVSFTSPYEAFTAIWDREIISVIVRETNTYAQQLASSMLSNATIYPNSRITRWQDTDVNEFYTYLTY